MNQSEKKLLTKEERKAEIRERYKGLNPENMEVIPADKKPDFYDKVHRRVAVYVRVSTDNLQQTSSYELQKNYYEDKVANNEYWTLVEIYADEGISGTSLNHRDQFNRMIADCKAGKIDMIITKSVSRFARNIVDCVVIVRELQNLKNPVGVFFETENIFTLDDNTEMALSFTATLAQEESHTKSNIMNASIEMRFSHGILLTPVLLGYDHDEKGNLVVNEDESKTIRLIFFMYIYGYSTKEIAEALTKLERVSKKGNKKWTSSSVTHYLRNERYCGDVLTRKTFTPRYLDHKSKKNRGDRTQHWWRNHHEPIISRDDFIAVQHMLNNNKYGGNGVLPELKVLETGSFKGFVRINTHWAVFKPEDYIKASRSVYGDSVVLEEEKSEEFTVKAESGQFDFRGFEVARSQFFNTKDRMTVTFSPQTINFSSMCIRKFNNNKYIEMFVHPEKKLLFIIECDSTDKNAMRWSKLTNTGETIPRLIPAGAFVKTIYGLFGWNSEIKYRFQGVKKTKGKKAIILFDLNETEMLVPPTAIQTEEPSEPESEETPDTVKKNRSLLAVPTTWAADFGNDFYVHGQSQDREINEKRWGQMSKVAVYSNMPELQVTSKDDAAMNIKQIITDMREEAANE